MIEGYTAIYMPGSEDRFQGGFLTEEAAWEYVYTQMCRGCKESLQRLREGTAGEDDDLLPCAAEWDVLPSREWEEIRRES